MSWSRYAALYICAVLIGLDKGGIPGLAALGMAFVLSAVESEHGETAGHYLAIFVPVLATADLWAIYAYRNSINWKVMRLVAFPMGFGISLGFFMLGKLSDDMIRRSSGIALLALAVIHYAKSQIQSYFMTRSDMKEEERKLPLLPHTIGKFSKAGANTNNSQLILDSTDGVYPLIASLCFGFASGVLTVIANVAGPVIVVYLISLQLEKRQINGTRAFIFVFANAFKIPCQIYIGNLQFGDVYLVIPLAVVAGATALITEAYLISYVNQKWFERMSWALVTVGAIKLIALTS